MQLPIDDTCMPRLLFDDPEGGVIGSQRVGVGHVEHDARELIMSP